MHIVQSFYGILIRLFNKSLHFPIVLLYLLPLDLQTSLETLDSVSLPQRKYLVILVFFVVYLDYLIHRVIIMTMRIPFLQANKADILLAFLTIVLVLLTMALTLRQCIDFIYFL